nr:MAG TPA: hypothetical protein [Bacteriophage sp.]
MLNTVVAKYGHCSIRYYWGNRDTITYSIKRKA